MDRYGGATATGKACSSLGAATALMPVWVKLGAREGLRTTRVNPDPKGGRPTLARCLNEVRALIVPMFYRVSPK